MQVTKKIQSLWNEAFTPWKVGERFWPFFWRTFKAKGTMFLMMIVSVIVIELIIVGLSILIVDLLSIIQ